MAELVPFLELGLAAAQTLFAALQCPELKAICSGWGYKSQLEELKKTVTTIKNVLLDAETRVLSNEERGHIKELKDVVYEADDLFDEFVTRLELKQLRGSNIKKGGKFYKKVRLFFSSDESRFSQACRMFYKVEEISTKLNSIVDNHKRFALSVDYKPICLRGEETCSYVDVKDIIGRHDDKKAVVKMLLESKADQKVSFLSIVGVGGQGKTALAQLVYNDKDVEQVFGDLRFWVCVSDQDKQQFDVKLILSKILKEVANAQESFDAFELQQLQKELKKELGGRKYMLVLDDMWNEDRGKWLDLQKFLMFGEKGSRVLVTTRSKMTTTVVGDDDHTYKLQGLSPENSWNLFKRVAFRQGNGQRKEFLEVGENIIAKCCNNPLAIRVVGSLLYGQHIEKWKLCEELGLSKIKEGDNQIMSVLKLSYYNLKSSLKSCFTYCALFPKDYEIKKEKLIHLWMAQGYIETANQGGRNIADVAEEYFLILLRRCFFQDVHKDNYGRIMSVKLHDLMHDVAQEMAGNEIQIHEFGENNIGDGVRHWSFDGENDLQISSITTKLRSYICLSSPKGYRSSKIVLDQLKCLRVLELLRLDDIKSLESIGELLHLRYLDLSYGKFESFAGSSITKLHNLQTFILRQCDQLRELPSLSKLPYLKSLILLGLYRLEYMEKTSSFIGAEETPFFPSLEYLRITMAYKLKGWFDAEVDHCQSIRRFLCLSRLEIWLCPNLATFPACPGVKTLRCEKLEILKQVVGKVNGTSCLATLTFYNWPKPIKGFNSVPLWEALNQSLRTLEVGNYYSGVIPWEIWHLTSLQTFKIMSCTKMENFPPWMNRLTSLHDLQIIECSKVLYEKYGEPFAKDRYQIQYIPNITIRKEPSSIIFGKGW